MAAVVVAINILIAGHADGLDLRLMSGVIAWSTAVGVAGALVLAAS